MCTIYNGSDLEISCLRMVFWMFFYSKNDDECKITLASLPPLLETRLSSCFGRRGQLHSWLQKSTNTPSVELLQAAQRRSRWLPTVERATKPAVERCTPAGFTVRLYVGFCIASVGALLRNSGFQRGTAFHCLAHFQEFQCLHRLLELRALQIM